MFNPELKCLRIVVFCCWGIGLLCWSTSLSAAVDAGEHFILQDFEEGYQAESGTSLSREWKSSGQQSLKIEPKNAAYVKTLKTADWTQYNELHISFHNPSADAVPVALELCDAPGNQGTYWDRYQNSFEIQPGNHTLKLYYSGGIWRGESSLQFRNLKISFDFSKMVWIGVRQTTSKEPLYIDKIELVKIPSVKLKDAYAFDFGSNRSSVMQHYYSINPETLYSADKGYGMVSAGGRVLSVSMTYPTALLGDGIAWPASGFRVDLPGGDYIAWIAFERGGFWQGESAQYQKAILKVNGKTIHEHNSQPRDIHFLFEDTEITDLAEIAEKLIWPAHAISTFPLKAAAGDNTFTLTIEGSSHFPLRVAGLIIAPATPEGKDFIKKHEQLQRDAITETYPKRDLSRRGAGRHAPAAALEYECLPSGENVYPGDWPSTNAGNPLRELHAISGQTLCIHLGLYAKNAGSISVSADALKSAATAIPAIVSHGRYLPNRPPRIGSAWIDIHHYRPESTFNIGPDLSRSLIVEFRIPAEAPSGAYTSAITVEGAGGRLKIPVRVNIVASQLAELPIFYAFLMSGAAVQKDDVGEELFWRLQEDMVKEQMSHGMTGLTSGAFYRFKDGKLDGGDVVKLVRIAEKYGKIRGILNYCDFINVPRADLPAFGKALSKFCETETLPRHYLNCYDEPSLQPELQRVLDSVKAAKGMGYCTLGLTSRHADPLWEELVKNTDCPTLGVHTAADIRWLKDAGCHPWIYNNGSSRYSTGLHVRRAMHAGAEGRCQYAANNVCGYAFHNLDGRESAISFFAVHSKFGTLKTPMWLATREGLLDLRIRLTLEKMAKPDDPALSLWTIASDELYRKDEAQWPDAALEKARCGMLRRIAELSTLK
jgi:hypothetical protein